MSTLLRAPRRGDIVTGRQEACDKRNRPAMQKSTIESCTEGPLLESTPKAFPRIDVPRIATSEMHRAAACFLHVRANKQKLKQERPYRI